MKFHLLLCILPVLAWLPLLPLMGGEAWLNGQDAVLVLGSPNFTENSTGLSRSQLRLPGGVCVDPTTGKIFVSDSGNNRVLRFASFSELSNGAEAEAVFGQQDFESDVDGRGEEAGLFGPQGIVIGPDGELWVADLYNNRVVRFENAAIASSGVTADGVLGQPNLTTRDGELDDESLHQPISLAIDDAGNLYVADARNNRILLFRDARNLSNGAAADTVFGQEDMETGDWGTTSSTLNNPLYIAISSDGHLYIADTYNNRVLVFESPLSASNGAEADRVIGQADFTSKDDGHSSTGIFESVGLAFSPDGDLWLGDSYNQRVLRYTNASDLAGIVAASTVIGNPDMTTKRDDIDASTLHYTADVSTDSEGRLYVVDGPHSRVLVFEECRMQPDTTVGKRLGLQLGNGIYNLSGSGQFQNIKSNRRKTRCYHTVGNDGTVDDIYQIYGRGTNSKFRVKHYRVTGGRTNISAAVKRGQHLDPIAESTALAYSADIIAKKRDRRGRFAGFLQSASTTDRETDRSTLRVKYRP